jgi:hypothetical protein
MPKPQAFSGALSLNAGQTRFSGGSVLPPSVLTFSVDGTDPTIFQFKDLHADKIGPVQVNGRWDGERLRGQAWWPKQSHRIPAADPAGLENDAATGSFMRRSPSRRRPIRALKRAGTGAEIRQRLDA